MKKKLFAAAIVTAAGMMAFSAGAQEAVTEEIAAEVETEDGVLVPNDENFGKWKQLGRGIGDFALDLYTFYVLPDAISDDYGSFEFYEMSDDGVLTVTAGEEDLPDTMSAISIEFVPRILDEADLDKYQIAPSEEAFVDQTPVLEVTTYATLTTNPLSPEDTVSSCLYAYVGYSDPYIEQLLMEHPWTVGGKTLTFTKQEGSATGEMDLNNGETTGEFFILGGSIRMEWGDNTFHYAVQSISTDAQTRGNVTLVEEGKPDRTLELVAVQGDAAEEEMTE